MQSLCLSSWNQLLTPHSYSSKLHTLSGSSFHGISFNPPPPPLRVSKCSTMKRRSGAVCLSAPLSINELQWVSTVSSAVLMLVKGTGIHKAFLVPLLALQAPSTIVSWIRGEYGIWCAFMAILVMNLRGKQEGVVLSLAIAAYLAFQHFFRAGSIKNAFEQGSIATLAIIFTVAVPCLLLI